MNLGGTIRPNRLGIIVIVVACIILFLYINSHNIGLGSDDKGDPLKNDNFFNLRKLLIASIEIAERGGKEVIAVREERNLQEKSKGKTKEGANDPVTLADLKSHCVMFYSLIHAFPKLKVISEENIAEKDCLTLPMLNLAETGLHISETLVNEMVHIDDVAVWIDPLDATQEYTEGLLEYVTTMVCVAIKGKAVIGVIHKPFETPPRTSWAWVNRASSPDLTNHKGVDDAKLRLIVSRSHAGQAQNITRQLFGTEDISILTAGGAGYKVLQVVAGNATAYVHVTAIKKWDVCAGNAILTSQGGALTTLANEAIDYSNAENSLNQNGILGTLTRHEYFIEKYSKYGVA